MAFPTQSVLLRWHASKRHYRVMIERNFPIIGNIRRDIWLATCVGAMPLQCVGDMDGWLFLAVLHSLQVKPKRAAPYGNRPQKIDLEVCLFDAAPVTPGTAACSGSVRPSRGGSPR